VVGWKKAKSERSVVNQQRHRHKYAHVVGVLREVRPARDDFSVLIGWEDLILPSLLAGVDGSTCAEQL
jgi:dihydrodipicolinate synthase/N-acetylneuraminate lyase